MPEYLAPGVYVEEVSSGSKPIEGVSTSTAGFLGRTERGPDDAAYFVTSFTEYQRKFGGFLDEPPDAGPDNGFFLPHAVKGFFDNGGRRAYISRAVNDKTGPAFAPLHNLTLTAIGRGAWGRNVYVLLHRGSLGERYRLTIAYFRNGVREEDWVNPFADRTKLPAGKQIPRPDVFEDYDDLKDARDVRRTVNDRSALLQIPEDARLPLPPTSELPVANDPALRWKQLEIPAGSPVDAAIKAAQKAQTDAGTVALVAVRAAQVIKGVADLAAKANEAIGKATEPAAGQPVTIAPPEKGALVTAKDSIKADDVVTIPALTAIQTTAGVVLADATKAAGAADAANTAAALATAAQDAFVASGKAEAEATKALDHVAEAWKPDLRLAAAEAKMAASEIAVLGQATTPNAVDIRKAARRVEAAAKRIKTEIIDKTIELPSEPQRIATDLVAAAKAAVTAADSLLNATAAGGKTAVNTAKEHAQVVAAKAAEAQRIAAALKIQSDNLSVGSKNAPSKIILADNPEDGHFVAALGRLDDIDDISILVAPEHVDKQRLQSLDSELISSCQRLADRVVLLSATYAEKDDLKTLQKHAGQDSTFAAFYHPWIEITDPLSGASPKRKTIPPIGHIAGICARTDITRGVHKAPANEVVIGALDLPVTVNKGVQDVLNPRGVNCIRDFRPDGRGIRLWGARTISSDPEWKYLNVRRLFLFLEESIDQGTQWVVFEPNSDPTWAAVRRNITNFLTTVWRSGALQGSKPEEAFYVKCDYPTTMTQDDIDNGRLICVIGVAPVKPAEFVIIRISQKTLEAVA